MGTVAQVRVTSEHVVGSVLELSLAALELGDGDGVDGHARPKFASLVSCQPCSFPPLVGLLMVEAASSAIAR